MAPSWGSEDSHEGVQSPLCEVATSTNGAYTPLSEAQVSEVEESDFSPGSLYYFQNTLALKLFAFV